MFHSESDIVTEIYITPHMHNVFLAIIYYQYQDIDSIFEISIFQMDHIVKATHVFNKRIIPLRDKSLNF